MAEEMTIHRETRILPYSAAQIYALVADVAAYPEFLPWCAGARLRGSREADDHTVLDADLVISFKVFREKFTSRVILWPKQNRIDTEYLDGPFRYLRANWHFTPVAGGTEVSFFVEFEFRSIVLQKLIGVVFNEAMHRIVAAFEARAHQLYGAGNRAV